MNKVKAEYKSGVLTVTLAKKEVAKAKDHPGRNQQQLRNDLAGC
jgi:HSP20 family molecular chaperone IbpA